MELWVDNYTFCVTHFVEPSHNSGGFLFKNNLLYLLMKTEELIRDFIQDYLHYMNLKLVTISYNKEKNTCLLLLNRVQKNMFSSISLMEVSNKFRLKNIVEGMFGCECLIDIGWNKEQVYGNR